MHATSRYQTSTFVLASAAGLLAVLSDVPAKPPCLAEAKGSKKCACPVAPDETVVIPCSSIVRPETCGVCSVVSKDGERDGRSCLTVSE